MCYRSWISPDTWLHYRTNCWEIKVSDSTFSSTQSLIVHLVRQRAIMTVKKNPWLPGNFLFEIIIHLMPGDYILVVYWAYACASIIINAFFHKCECFVFYGYLSYNDLLRNTLNSYRLNKASTISLYGLSFMDAVLCDF